MNADQHRKKQQGKRTYATSVCIIWAKEYTQSFKCHYHVCLFHGFTIPAKDHPACVP
ncbi:inovirus-type Gp2 protein, partial [Escherichia coli]|nr:inovirus-type Gp2 protein [Escherichia coli]